MLIEISNDFHFQNIQTLAVNLNAFEKIVIRKIDNAIFDLALESAIDNSTIQHITIKSYETHKKAFNAYQSLKIALENKELIWSPENT